MLSPERAHQFLKPMVFVQSAQIFAVDVLECPRAAAAGCVFWPLSKVPPSLARFSTVSACPHGHPRLLPLAGTDASKSPNCDGQAGRLRRGVPLTRPTLRPSYDNPPCLNSCAPEKHSYAPKEGILTPGFGYPTTPLPKFPDPPGMGNRFHFSYASLETVMKRIIEEDIRNSR